VQIGKFCRELYASLTISPDLTGQEPAITPLVEEV
jgi:hypothetical protein